MTDRFADYLNTEFNYAGNIYDVIRFLANVSMKHYDHVLVRFIANVFGLDADKYTLEHVSVGRFQIPHRT